MNILIIGSGGREYAIALKLKSEKNINLYFAPGNGATSRLGENLNIKDFRELAEFAKKNSIEQTLFFKDIYHAFAKRRFRSHDS